MTTIDPLTANDPVHVGRYRILGVLGAGGMGRVLLGAGPDGRLVAVKQVHPHLLGEADYRMRFRREVTAATRVSGAFTAPVVDFDVDGPEPWLASLYIAGVPLDVAVERHGPLPAPAVRMLAVGLASALRAIHDGGVIHRDLKPSNVLLAADGPRVIDFGIAQATDSTVGLTEVGSVLGSPAYMSPEQALAKEISSASDIFSLGSLLMMAATGTGPFTAPSLAYTLFKIAHAEPEMDSVPAELRELIVACLHKDPQARPTTAQLLDYLSRPPEPATAWPDPIREDIDALSQRLSATVTPTSESSTKRMRPGANPPTGSPRAVSARLGRASRAKRIRIFFACVATLVVATLAALSIVASTEDQVPSAASGPTIAELRKADACAWIHEALGSTVPAEIAGSWPTDTSEWSRTMTSTWGCYIRAGEHRITFEPGASLKDFVPIDRNVGEIRMLAGKDSSSCERGIASSGTEQQWGPSVSSYDTTDCPLAEYMLSRLVTRPESPPMSSANISLDRVDPCALLDRDLLNSRIGPLPASPSTISAHSCEWEGSSTIRVSAATEGPKDPSQQRTIDLGNGVQILAPTTDARNECVRTYDYRPVEDGGERLGIAVGSYSVPFEERCAIAESVLASMIGKLPPH
ncbi:serine/threonine-protein kinase [Nocardia jejuensis]|uniref:serine/threonine-protein kinase n=1 Tax=Nocardia jejuensis TaxID=328049 RepID=UPI00082E7B69|nr:serine/threonine-protein kinase [Nocardia jejuensis]